MSAPGSFRLAVAQPVIDRREPESSRVDDAVELIRAAGEGGAELVLFPESYPGPITAGLDHDAGPAVAEACRETGLAACWGRVRGWHGQCPGTLTRPGLAALVRC